MTIGEKIEQMKRELIALVTYFNKDGSHTLATEVQATLMLLSDLSNSLAESGEEDTQWPSDDYS